MSFRLGLTPEALADLRDARDWYQSQRPGWGDVFVRSVEACFDRIQRAPETYQRVHHAVRRATFRRFPHGILYWVEGDQIVVFAIWHARRNPVGWKNRIHPSEP